jgi:hypothetical protein
VQAVEQIRGEHIMPTYSGNLIGRTGDDGTTATGVAANYLKMPAQTTSGVGQPFTNFTTRQLRFIKVVATNNSTAVRFDKDTGLSGGTGTYASPASVYSNAVRALQTVAEVYALFTPGTAGFIAVIAEDTVNDNAVGTNIRGDVAVTSAITYGVMEAAVSAALTAAGLTTTQSVTITAVDVNSTGTAIADVA